MDAPLLTKRCPECAEEVKAEALICRFCRYSFSTPTRVPEMRRCAMCAEDVPADVAICPYCGDDASVRPDDPVVKRPNLFLRIGVPFLILTAMLVFLLVQPAPTYVPSAVDPGAESGASPTPCVTIDPIYSDPDADFDPTVTLDPNANYCD